MPRLTRNPPSRTMSRHSDPHALPTADHWSDEFDAPAQGAGPSSPPSPFIDQADGLRRLFAGRTLRFVPVVSNPSVTCGGAMLERLSTVYAEQGLSTLVVDAGERARAPRELTRFDLSEGIEMLSAQVSYLAARGLPLRYVDASGSTTSFLDALARASGDADVVLLHAPATDLARLLARRVQSHEATALRPILLCDERADSVTHAYGAIKLLAARAGLMAHDLLISAAANSPRAKVVAERLARCADNFLGAVLHDWVAIDPREAATVAPSLALQGLARGQFACALVQRVSDLADGMPAERLHRSALPAQATMAAPQARAHR